ncbi:MAG: hypothetical protein IEMM0002_0984 [bacterium]|nr:MAG: hypothetical protein IEMM0002_0984 [bacterium]
MKLIERLMDILSQNVEAYESMAEKTERERRVVKKGSREELAEIVKEKEKIGLELEKLEQARVELIGKIAEEVGRPVNEISLGEIAAMPENRALKNRILAIRQKLTGAVSLTKKLNDYNRHLIGSVMRSTVNSIQMLNGLIEPAVTYSAARRIQNRAPSGTLLKRSL